MNSFNINYKCEKDLPPGNQDNSYIILNLTGANLEQVGRLDADYHNKGFEFTTSQNPPIFKFLINKKHLDKNNPGHTIYEALNGITAILKNGNFAFQIETDAFFQNLVEAFKIKLEIIQGALELLVSPEMRESFNKEITQLKDEKISRHNAQTAFSRLNNIIQEMKKSDLYNVSSETFAEFENCNQILEQFLSLELHLDFHYQNLNELLDKDQKSEEKTKNKLATKIRDIFSAATTLKDDVKNNREDAELLIEILEKTASFLNDDGIDNSKLTQYEILAKKVCERFEKYSAGKIMIGAMLSFLGVALLIGVISTATVLTSLPSISIITVSMILVSGGVIIGATKKTEPIAKAVTQFWKSLPKAEEPKTSSSLHNSK